MRLTSACRVVVEALVYQSMKTGRWSDTPTAYLLAPRYPALDDLWRELICALLMPLRPSRPSTNYPDVGAEEGVGLLVSRRLSVARLSHVDDDSLLCHFRCSARGVCIGASEVGLCVKAARAVPSRILVVI